MEAPSILWEKLGLQQLGKVKSLRSAESVGDGMRVQRFEKS